MNAQDKTLFAKNKLPRFWEYLDKPRELGEDLKLCQSIFLAGDRLRTPASIVTKVLNFCVHQVEFIYGPADIVLAVKDACKVESLPLDLRIEFELYLIQCYVEGDAKIVKIFEDL